MDRGTLYYSVDLAVDKCTVEGAVGGGAWVEVATGVRPGRCILVPPSRSPWEEPLSSALTLPLSPNLEPADLRQIPCSKTNLSSLRMG